MKYTKEWLKKEAKNLYKAGDRIDQKPAFDGAGSYYVLRKILVEVNEHHSDGKLNVSIDGFGVWNSEDKIWAPVLNRKTFIDYEIF
jgi:hypothetical protein